MERRSAHALRLFLFSAASHRQKSKGFRKNDSAHNLKNVPKNFKKVPICFHATACCKNRQGVARDNLPCK